MTERIFHLNSSDNLISRLSASSLQENSLSSVQQRIDTAVSQFSRGMTDGNVLAAMTVGSIAYRMTQIGVLSLGAGTTFSSMFLRPTAAALGLFNEVVAFEGTSRLFQSYSQSSHANLWSLRGEGGWLQSLPVSLLHFATLKMGGALGQGSNLIVQHA
ncbi:MAG: hypothetical protein JNK65_05415, partial [Deltaproteobacteria bacterium]|nr:hypothetical protein [Deltaproteobacteria bacterium]